MGRNVPELAESYLTFDLKVCVAIKWVKIRML